jgi:hypothetical protein
MSSLDRSRSALVLPPTILDSFFLIPSLSSWCAPEPRLCNPNVARLRPTQRLE